MGKLRKVFKRDNNVINISRPPIEKQLVEKKKIAKRTYVGRGESRYPFTWFYNKMQIEQTLNHISLSPVHQRSLLT